MIDDVPNISLCDKSLNDIVVPSIITWVVYACVSSYMWVRGFQVAMYGVSLGILVMIGVPVPFNMCSVIFLPLGGCCLSGGMGWRVLVQG